MAEEVHNVVPNPNVSETVELSLGEALEEVIRIANTHNGLRKGLHECVKVIDRGVAQLCFLASDCDHDEYKALVEALCREQAVPVVNVDTKEQLATWCGLASYDEEGNVRKTPKCSCAVITDYGYDSPAYQVVQSYLEAED